MREAKARQNELSIIVNSDFKMNKLPLSPELIKQLSQKNGLPDTGSASIREIFHLVNLIERETGLRYVRMEMGVPG